MNHPVDLNVWPVTFACPSISIRKEGLPFGEHLTALSPAA